MRVEIILAPCCTEDYEGIEMERHKTFKMRHCASRRLKWRPLKLMINGEGKLGFQSHSDSKL